MKRKLFPYTYGDEGPDVSFCKLESLKLLKIVSFALFPFLTPSYVWALDGTDTRLSGVKAFALLLATMCLYKARLAIKEGRFMLAFIFIWCFYVAGTLFRVSVKIGTGI